MSDEILSQDEIDALLGREHRDEEPIEDGYDIDALAQIVNAAMSTGVDAIADLLDSRSSLELVAVDVGSLRELLAESPPDEIWASAQISGGLTGEILVFFPKEGGTELGELMMGDQALLAEADGEPLQGMDEVFLELGSQLGAAWTSIFGTEIDVKFDDSRLREGSEQSFGGVEAGDTVVQITYAALMGDLSFDVRTYLPIDTSEAILTFLMEDTAQAVSEEHGESIDAHAGSTPLKEPSQKDPSPSKVQVSPPQFADFSRRAPEREAGNIDLLLDVPLRVTVELGRTTMRIQDILALGKGSVIELDKLAGEPVEIFVNGKLLARGEVVTIDENFGVKITDIVHRSQRVANLQ